MIVVWCGVWARWVMVGLGDGELEPCGQPSELRGRQASRVAMFQVGVKLAKSNTENWIVFIIIKAL